MLQAIGCLQLAFPAIAGGWRRTLSMPGEVFMFPENSSLFQRRTGEAMSALASAGQCLGGRGAQPAVLRVKSANVHIKAGAARQAALRVRT